MPHREYIGLNESWKKILAKLPEQNSPTLTQVNEHTYISDRFKFNVFNTHDGKPTEEQTVGARELAREAYQTITSARTTEERIAQRDRIMQWGENTYLVKNPQDTAHVIALQILKKAEEQTARHQHGQHFPR